MLKMKIKGNRRETGDICDGLHHPAANTGMHGMSMRISRNRIGRISCFAY
jgi:hypothetical protein